jgi:hypothetical protein
MDCVRDPNRSQFPRLKQPRQGHCIASIGLDPLCPWSTEARRPAPTCHKERSPAFLGISEGATTVHS